MAPVDAGMTGTTGLRVCKEDLCLMCSPGGLKVLSTQELDELTLYR